MFTDEELKAYSKIKAPDALYKKIVQTQRKPKKILYFASAVAACFAILISSFAFSSQNAIVINGQSLKDSVVFYDTAAASGRNLSTTVSIPIQIKGAKDTKISVKQGMLSINGKVPSQEVTVSSSEMVWWEFTPTQDDCVFEMQVSDKKGVQRVTLEYKNAKITVKKEKEQ